MAQDSESMLKALESTNKQVIAIMPLAAGSLKPPESLFKFIYKDAVAISVGITSEAEMEGRDIFSSEKVFEPHKYLNVKTFYNIKIKHNFKECEKRWIKIIYFLLQFLVS